MVKAILFSLYDFRIVLLKTSILLRYIFFKSTAELANLNIVQDQDVQISLPFNDLFPPHPTKHVFCKIETISIGQKHDRLTYLNEIIGTMAFETIVTKIMLI